MSTPGGSSASGQERASQQIPAAAVIEIDDDDNLKDPTTTTSPAAASVAAESDASPESLFADVPLDDTSAAVSLSQSQSQPQSQSQLDERPEDPSGAVPSPVPPTTADDAMDISDNEIASPKANEGEQEGEENDDDDESDDRPAKRRRVVTLSDRLAKLDTVELLLSQCLSEAGAAIACLHPAARIPLNTLVDSLGIKGGVGGKEEHSGSEPRNAVDVERDDEEAGLDGRGEFDDDDADAGTNGDGDFRGIPDIMTDNVSTQKGRAAGFKAHAQGYFDALEAATVALRRSIRALERAQVPVVPIPISRPFTTASGGTPSWTRIVDGHKRRIVLKQAGKGPSDAATMDDDKIDALLELHKLMKAHASERATGDTPTVKTSVNADTDMEEKDKAVLISETGIKGTADDASTMV